MMNIFIKYLIFILVLLIGCTPNTKTIEGDLYYDVYFKPASTYILPDSLKSKVRVWLDTTNYDNLDPDDSIFFVTFSVLKKHELLDNPYIRLLLDDGSVVVIYVDPQDYSVFTTFRYRELIENHEKVRVEVNTSELADGMYQCKKVIKTEKIPGETLIEQGIFRIDDYN